MRAGDPVLVFDGRNGEWAADLLDATKKRVTLICTNQTRPQEMPADIWLLFAPLKKARMDMIVEKSVELGAARLLPVITEFTNSERVRTDRLRAQVIEAAEQCGATHIAEVGEPERLEKLVSNWPDSRALLFCDETAAGPGSTPASWPAAPAAILIGPEGGFSQSERDSLRSRPFAHRVSLGPRILRAETAAIAAMALWQSVHGDWR